MFLRVVADLPGLSRIKGCKTVVIVCFNRFNRDHYFALVICYN